MNYKYLIPISILLALLLFIGIIYGKDVVQYTCHITVVEAFENSFNEDGTVYNVTKEGNGSIYTDMIIDTDTGKFYFIGDFATDEHNEEGEQIVKPFRIEHWKFLENVKPHINFW